MTKILGQNKTKQIHLRVDSDVKEMARKKAERYFGGNMSMMFRYAVYRCNFEELEGKTGADFKKEKVEECTSTLYRAEGIELLKVVHKLFKNILQLLTPTSKNINQIAHHANTMSLKGRSPVVSRSDLDRLEDLGTDIKYLIGFISKQWQDIKSKLLSK